MTKNLISIVLPVYNGEKYLKKSIDSILTQTFSNFELILVNDGSTDDSGSICDEYAKNDCRVRVVHIENQGVSVARNTGIAYANGEYIVFIDSDDYLEPNFLNIMTSSFENTDCELIVCGYNVVKDNRIIEKRVYKESGIDELNRDQVFLLFDKILVSAPWCKLFKTSIIKANKIVFPEDVSLGEDMLFNFRYIDNIMKVKVINDSLYNYRTDNENSLLRKYRKELLNDYLNLNSGMKEIIKDWDVDRNSMQGYLDGCYYQFENAMYNTFNKENSDSFYLKLKYNNKIIKSKRFKEALNNFSGKLRIDQKISYKLKNYLPTYLFLKLREVIKYDKI